MTQDRAHWLLVFRRLLRAQVQHGLNSLEARELYDQLGPALKQIEGLWEFIWEMAGRLQPDGQWKPGEAPQRKEVEAPSAAPTQAACKFCQSPMLKDPELKTWRCQANTLHRFWLNLDLEPGQQGVWMSASRTDPGTGPGPIPEWAEKYSKKQKVKEKRHKSAIN